MRRIDAPPQPAALDRAFGRHAAGALSLPRLRPQVAATVADLAPTFGGEP